MIACIALCVLALPSSGHAQVQLGADKYLENFARIENVKTAGVYPWTDNVTVPGWYATASAKGPVSYRVTKGATTSISPPLWVVRIDPAHVALGTIRGAKNDQPLFATFGACFVNKTGKVITSLAISYRGQQWVQNTGGADRLIFQYSLDATSLASGQWKDHDALSFNAPHTGASQMTAVDGTRDDNGATLGSTIIGLTIKPDETFWVRWSDFDATGEDAALAVGDFSLQAGTAP